MEVDAGKLGSISASMQHSSAITDADDLMSFFTSILKDIVKKLFLRLQQYQNVSINHGLLTLVKMQSKRATGPLRGSNVNHPRVT